MASLLDITIQRRREDGTWPVVAERQRSGRLLTVRSEGRLNLAAEPSSAVPRVYGTMLGQAIFRESIRDALTVAVGGAPDGTARVLLFVEAEELRMWRWEWLCAPLDGSRWEFLSLEQRAPFSLYLPSLTDRAYPPIGRHDLRALVVVASPADPGNRYGLTPFDVGQNVARLQSIFDDQMPSEVLAQAPGTAGAPTLDEVVRKLTDGDYTILHLVCHGWFNPERGETILYLERPGVEPGSGIAAEPVTATELIARLAPVRRLPHLIFLSMCDSGAPEAEQRLGGLAQRLVRELGIPAVIGMSERVTIATAHALAEAFYLRLLAQGNTGEVDRALAEAYAGLASRPDVHVPALYSRLAGQPLFSVALDRELTPAELRRGLQELHRLLEERAPVLQPILADAVQTLGPGLGVVASTLSPAARQERETALRDVNALCQEAVDVSFHALGQGGLIPAYDGRCPFQGLSAFRAEDVEFFFGREALITKLQQKLATHPFLPVLGPSGSGKSSLVLAGLSPRLQRQFPELQLVEMTPGSTPMEQLRVRQARLACGPVLYLVDQFEELFTLCHGERTQQRAFIAALLELADQGQRVVLTMRADFWGECAPHAALKARMQDRQELVAPMNASELRAAMEQQAAKVGLRFEADLSHKMLEEVAGEPGAMPLLQHALRELWKRRHGRWLRTSEYRALGGVKQAIAQTADRLYNELPPVDQQRVRNIFVRLTQLGEASSAREEQRDTRRRVRLAELVPAGSGPEATRARVKQLADAVLVVTNWNTVSQHEEVEVAHEALIQHWGRLRDWIDADRAGLRARARLTEAAREWSHAGRDALYLYTGSPLAVAREWDRLNPGQLSLEEDEFLQCSLEAQQRREANDLAVAQRVARAEAERAEEAEKRAQAETERAEQAERYAKEQKEAASKLRRLAIVAGGAAVVASALLVITVVLEGETQRALKIALSRQLAAQALVEIPKNPRRSLLLAVESITRTQTDGASDRMTACSLLHNVLAATGGLPLSGGTTAVTATAFSPDGKWLATGSADGTVRLWNPELPASSPIVLNDLSGHISFGDPNEVRPGVGLTLSFSADSRWIVASGGGTASLWDLTSPGTAHPVSLPGYRHGVKAAAFSPSGRCLAVAGDDGTVRLWDPEVWDLNAVPAIAEPKCLNGLLGLDSQSPFLVFSADGSRLVAWALLKHTVLVWNIAADGAASGPLSLSTPSVDDGSGVPRNNDALAVALSPDGSRLAVANAYFLHLWDLTADLTPVNPTPDPLLKSTQWIFAVSFSPDGHRLAEGGVDHLVRLWDLTTADFASHATPLRGQTATVESIVFSPDSRSIVTAGDDGDARLSNLTGSDSPQVVMHGHEGAVYALAIDPTGHQLVTASEDATARLWTIPDPSTEPAVLHEPSGGVARSDSAAGNAVAFSRDGRLASASGDKDIRVWRVATPVVLELVLNGHGSAVNATAFSPDARWLAAANLEHGKVAWLWDLTNAANSAVPIVMAGNQQPIMAIAFSPAGRWFATGSQDGTVRVWDLTAGALTTPRHVLSSHQGAIKAIAFSDDGKRLISVSSYWSTGETISVGVWDMTAAEPATNPIILGQHFEWVSNVAVSPDGRWVAAASLDETARLWDTRSANPAANPVILHFHNQVNEVAFSPNGHWLAASANDSHTQLVDLRDPAAEAVHFLGPKDRIFATDFSPDGRWLVVVGEDNSVWLWDPEDRNLEPTILHAPITKYTKGIAFSPDGRWLAIAIPNDATTRLWSLDVKELLAMACRTAGRSLTKDERRPFLGTGSGDH